MILSMKVLLAPREIRVGRVSGLPEAPHNGMLAGLRRSNFFARLLLSKTLEAMHRVIPQAGPRQYVDDLAQLVVGDRAHVIHFASTGGWMLIEALRRLKVVISPKSVVVGSNIRIAREISDWIFNRCGMRLKAVVRGADSDCGGASRAAEVACGREVKADDKLRRVEFLRRFSRDARKLVPR